MTLREYLDQARGMVTNLAKRPGKSQGFISNLRHGKPVPPALCIEIEKATDGLVTCEELRPEIDWGYLRCVKTAYPCGASEPP